VAGTCHDLADAPVLVRPAAAQTAPMPAVARVGGSPLDDVHRPFPLVASIATPQPHDPVLVDIPLRI
jgi:hypothetical protein